MTELVLEIWTDGSVTPSEGVSIGAKIMQEHLSLFVELTDSTQKAWKSWLKRKRTRKKKLSK